MMLVLMLMLMLGVNGAIETNVFLSSVNSRGQRDSYLPVFEFEFRNCF